MPTLKLIRTLEVMCYADARDKFLTEVEEKEICLYPPVKSMLQSREMDLLGDRVCRLKVVSASSWLSHERTTEMVRDCAFGIGCTLAPPAVVLPLSHVLSEVFAEAKMMSQALLFHEPIDYNDRPRMFMLNRNREVWNLYSAAVSNLNAVWPPANAFIFLDPRIM